MDIDNAETGFALIREGCHRENSILRLKERNVLGRGYDTTLTIISLYISRKHCVVFMGNDGQWYVNDCGTLNGTFINDTKIPPFMDYRLYLGDSLGLGIGKSSLDCFLEDDYYVYKLVSLTVPQFCGYDINNLCMDFTIMNHF